jgi:Ca2+-binding EF-hand superfamily protein
LAYIGINCGPNDLKEFMDRFDKDSDGKISFDEFKVIMKDKVRNEILTPEDILDDLRNEFENIDYKKDGRLNRM